MELEVHALPSIYKFKKAKQNIEDMIHISHFVHSYLKDGGDPRRCIMLVLIWNLKVVLA